MERLWVSPFDTLTRLCEIIQRRLDLTSTRVELANELLPLFFLGFRKGFTQALLATQLDPSFGLLFIRLNCSIGNFVEELLGLTQALTSPN